MRSFFLLIIYLFCGTLAYSQQAKILRIDPSFANGRPVSRIFDEIHYIPLETTSQSLFGTVNQLEISDSLFIILDRSTNAILFFNKDGKFQSKIKGRKGNILLFKFEKKQNRIQVFQTNNNNILQIIREKLEDDIPRANALIKRFIKVSYYDLNAQLLKVSSPEQSITPSTLSSIDLPDGVSFSNYAMAGEKRPDSDVFELNFYKNNQLYQSAFPYNMKKDIAQYGRYLNNPAGFSRTQNDTVVYFTRPLKYSIYKLTPHSIKEKYELVFPLKNTFPENYFTDEISQNDRLSFLRDNPTMITGLSNIHEVGNRLFFKISNNERWSNAPKSLVYNVKTGELISVNRLSADSTTFFLPLFDYAFNNESFKNIDGAYFYTYVSSARMFQAYDGNKEKNIVYPPLLESYFKSSDKKSNPVLVQLKPKNIQ